MNKVHTSAGERLRGELVWKLRVLTVAYLLCSRVKIGLVGGNVPGTERNRIAFKGKGNDNMFSIPMFKRFA